MDFFWILLMFIVIVNIILNVIFIETGKLLRSLGFIIQSFKSLSVQFQGSGWSQHPEP